MITTINSFVSEILSPALKTVGLPENPLKLIGKSFVFYFDYYGEKVALGGLITGIKKNENKPPIKLHISIATFRHHSVMHISFYDKNICNINLDAGDRGMQSERFRDFSGVLELL